MKVHEPHFQIGLALTIASILLLGYYVIFGHGMANTSFKQKVIIRPTSIVVTQGPKMSVSQAPTTTPRSMVAGVCPSLTANPQLKTNYQNADGTMCGYEPSYNFADETLENKIKSCLENSLQECGKAKAYFYLQGIEGGVEYLITTDESCKLHMERWGTTDPYCGYASRDCGEISSSFPFEVCDGK